MLMGIGLSPSLSANITEAGRLAASLAEELIFVHVEDGPAYARQEIESELSKVKERFPHRFLGRQGDISEGILKACEEENADLLLIGALPKEGLLRYYSGSIARQIIRKSNCSVMLLSQPETFPKAYSKLAVFADRHPKTKDTLKMSIATAQALQSQQLDVLAESFDASNSLDLSSDCTINIERHNIDGAAGYRLDQFSREHGTQILLLNSLDTKLGFLDRVFTHELDYLLSELPCAILMVHSSEEAS